MFFQLCDCFHQPLFVRRIERTHGKNLRNQQVNEYKRFLNCWWIEKGWRGPLPFPSTELKKHLKKPVERILRPVGAPADCPCIVYCQNVPCQKARSKEVTENPQSFQREKYGPWCREAKKGGSSRVRCQIIGQPGHAPIPPCFKHLNLPRNDEECLKLLKKYGKAKDYKHACLVFNVDP